MRSGPAAASVHAAKAAAKKPTLNVELPHIDVLRFLAAIARPPSLRPWVDVEIGFRRAPRLWREIGIPTPAVPIAQWLLKECCRFDTKREERDRAPSIQAAETPLMAAETRLMAAPRATYRPGRHASGSCRNLSGSVPDTGQRRLQPCTRFRQLGVVTLASLGGDGPPDEARRLADELAGVARDVPISIAQDAEESRRLVGKPEVLSCGIDRKP